MGNSRSDIAGVCLLLLLPVPFAALNAWLNPSAPSRDPMRLEEGEVSLAMLEEWGAEGYVLVDARTPEAYAAAHMPGAVNVYAGRFATQVGDLLDVWSPDVKVVVYCDSRRCGASEALAERLRAEFGMGDVYVLKGGWESWVERSGTGKEDGE